MVEIQPSLARLQSVVPLESVRQQVSVRNPNLLSPGKTSSGRLSLSPKASSPPAAGSAAHVFTFDTAARAAGTMPSQDSMAPLTPASALSLTHSSQYAAPTYTHIAKIVIPPAMPPSSFDMYASLTPAPLETQAEFFSAAQMVNVRSFPPLIDRFARTQAATFAVRVGACCEVYFISVWLWFWVVIVELPCLLSFRVLVVVL
jgi:hypothetical protein